MISWPAVCETILCHPIVQSQNEPSTSTVTMMDSDCSLQDKHYDPPLPPSQSDKLNQMKLEARAGAEFKGRLQGR